MIKAINISFTYGDIPLFERGNFSVGKNMKVGIVGQNGAGKSTLFKLMSGVDIPDTGLIEIGGSIASVPQEVKHDVNLEKAKTIREYIDYENKKETHELQKMLSGIGLSHLSIDIKPNNLSGGQKTCLAIIRALIQEADILLLDEPTNFLDKGGKKWVMDFLKSYPKTLLMISHDLDLIDNYIDKVVAINPVLKTIEEYGGNYSDYLENKQKEDELLQRKIINEVKHIKRMKKGLQKMDRFTSEKGVRQRTQLKKRIRRLELELPEIPPEIRKMRFSFPTLERVGEIPIMVKNIFKSYGDTTVLSNISLDIYRGERLALIGQNGAGKSTFIKILMGEVTPDNGSVLLSDQCRIGYYSQEHEAFDEKQTVIEAMRECSQLGDNIIRPLLAGFLFSGNKVDQVIGKLSGGEKTRLAIARLLSRNQNMLILDEPTTYLDILSQRVILEALKQYKGTQLIVSHTEDFIKELKPDRAFLLPENKIEIWSDELLNRVGDI